MRIFDTLHAQANDARLPGERFTATAGNRSVDRAVLIAAEFHGAPRKDSWRKFADKISGRGHCGRYQAPPALLQQTRGEVTYLAGKVRRCARRSRKRKSAYIAKRHTKITKMWSTRPVGARMCGV